MTEGYELADVRTPIARAITGGTGPYQHAQGQVTQQLLGFNQSEGVNLHFALTIVQP